MDALVRGSSANLELSSGQKRQQRCLEILAGLQAVMRAEMIPVEQALWVKALGCYEIDEIERAIAEYIATPGSEYLPRPGQIAAIIQAERNETRERLKQQAERETQADLLRRRDAGEFQMTPDEDAEFRAKIAAVNEKFAARATTVKPKVNIPTPPPCPQGSCDFTIPHGATMRCPKCGWTKAALGVA